MNELIFTAFQLVIMVVAALFAKHLIPAIKEGIGEEKVSMVTTWVKNAVLFAQQTMWAQTGAERKAYVLNFVTNLCAEKGIPLTQEQIDVLIEAAVKSMKIEEGTSKEE